MTSGTIRITARTLDLAREALADWIAEYPRRSVANACRQRGTRDEHIRFTGCASRRASRSMRLLRQALQ